jgi:hypothetical protein
VLSSPASPRGKLLKQYVCARITSMEAADLGLFDYDRHNALYYFIMNADEQIYMRYGGRDSASPDTYLNLRSLELALAEGLELHRDRASLPKAERPKPLFAREIPLLYERTIQRGQCVECHLIADFELQNREAAGTLDPPADLFPSPDIKTIGIELDVPKGLVVGKVHGPAADAGLTPGDTITHLEDTRVRTFGDLQYRYGKLARTATKLRLALQRAGQAREAVITLPSRWWYTDLNYRRWTTDPLVHFETQPLSAAEKRELGLPALSFAGRVVQVESFREMAAPELRKGDLIVGVDGAREDALSHTPELFIKLHCRAGGKATLSVIRNGKTFESKLQTERQSFRK